MVEVTAKNINELPMSGQLHAKEAAKRGWRMWMYEPGESHYRLERPDGRKLELYGSMPPTTSGVAAVRTDNKLITQRILEEHDLPVLEAYVFDSQSALARRIPELLQGGKKWVMKPLDQAHGFGITTAIADEQSLWQAWQRAGRYSSRILLQRYYENFVDIRITCIDSTFTAAALRIPAQVVGDGVSTIKTLMKQENQRPERGEVEFSKLTKIDEEAAEMFLGQSIERVPAKDERCQVMGIASASTGGETFDVTDHIPLWLREMAQAAAKAMQLPVTGVDILLSAEPRPESTEQELKPAIIELNKSPGMRVHEHVHHGKSQPMTAVLFDYLTKI